MERKGSPFKLHLLALVILAFSMSYFLPAQAIENGVSAQGNKAVVPIRITPNTGTPKGCSGAILTPRIIATAAHCVIDVNGQIYKDVKVGPPGASAQLESTWSTMYSIFSITGYKGDPNVKFNDIAYLVLRQPILDAAYVQIPSEDQVNYMRQSSTTLNLLGYGATRDSDETAPIYPSQISATFSSVTSNTLTNSGYALSVVGNTCTGDSGGPVIANLSGQDYVIGIITGATASNHCSRMENGGYYTSFTLLHRYTNILFMAANEAASLEIEERNSLLKSAENKSATLAADLAAARKEILRLQSKAKTVTITCVKANSIKKVTGINPKCPTGYIKK